MQANILSELLLFCTVNWNKRRKQNEKCKFEPGGGKNVVQQWEKWEHENYSEKAFNSRVQRAFSAETKKAKRIYEMEFLALVDKPRNVYESLTI